jgi:hypothetical protein
MSTGLRPGLKLAGTHRISEVDRDSGGRPPPRALGGATISWRALRCANDLAVRSPCSSEAQGSADAVDDRGRRSRERHGRRADVRRGRRATLRGHTPNNLKYCEHAPINMRKPKSDMAQGRDRDERLQEEDSMSSHLTPPLAATQPSPAVAAGPLPAPIPPAPTVTGQPAVAAQTLLSSPPPEVLDAMERAAQTHAELSAQGRELRFLRDAQGGRTRIEVRDRGGNVLKTLSPAQALAVAAGAPLE